MISNKNCIVTLLLLIVFSLFASSCTYDVATYDAYNSRVVKVKQTKLHKYSYYSSPALFGTLGYYQKAIKFSDNKNQNKVASTIAGTLFGIATSYLIDKLIAKEHTIRRDAKSFERRWEKAYKRQSNSNSESHLHFLEIEDILNRKGDYIRWYDYWMYENRDLISISFLTNSIENNQIDDYSLKRNGGFALNFQNEFSDFAFSLNSFFEPFDLKKINNDDKEEFAYYLGAAFDICYVAKLTDFIDFYNGIGYQYSYFDNFENSVTYPNLNTIYFKNSVFLRPFVDYYVFMTYKQGFWDLDNLNKKWYSIQIGVSYDF